MKPLTVWNNSYRSRSQTINGDAGGPSQRVKAPEIGNERACAAGSKASEGESA